MSIPLELGLKSTADGPRLTWSPVKELQTLRARSHRVGPFDVKAGSDPAQCANGELLEVRADIRPGASSRAVLTVRGVAVEYDAKKEELKIAGHAVRLPLDHGELRLHIFVDRTVIELFAADGLLYAPIPIIPKAEDRVVTFQVLAGSVGVESVSVDELQSIWKR